jgi:hypothetical protein
MGPTTTIAYKRMASLLAVKQGQNYCLIMRWLRCRLSFSHHSLFIMYTYINHFDYCFLVIAFWAVRTCAPIVELINILYM